MRTFQVDPSIEAVRKPFEQFKKPFECFAALTNAKLEAGDVFASHVLATSFHPFVAAMHLSFAQHRPLMIRPDDVALCIAQGVSNHINAHAEKVRSIFVDHDGQKDIEIWRDMFQKGSPDNDWPSAFKEFDEKIAERLKNGAHERLKFQFSTTTHVDSAAYSIVLMESMKAYFKYVVWTECGIPEVTLLGTVADWTKLYAQTAALFAWWDARTAELPDVKEVSLSWWKDALMPVLEKILESAIDGKVDTEFWQSIYKMNGGSGGPTVSGWVNTLFPYMLDGERQPTQKHERLAKWGEDWYSVDSSSFPTGVSSVPFVWKYYGTDYDMTFLGGFAGVAQDPDNFSVRAAMGWGVCERNATAAIEITKEIINTRDW
jgi:hypothetical protein